MVLPCEQRVRNITGLFERQKGLGEKACRGNTFGCGAQVAGIAAPRLG